MSKRTRRQFIEDSMFKTAAAATTAWHFRHTSQILAQETSTSPAEKLSVCCVGVGARGMEHMSAYLRRNDCEITWIVDVNETSGNKRADEIGNHQGRRPKVTRDMREAYDDASVDLVSVATPNHWHALAAIWAMQAGKDVYLEKPVSHNVSEGRRLIETARKYGRICQTGTQSRSNPGLINGIEFLQNGGIGKIGLARGLCYKRRPAIGPRGEYSVPKDVDYDRWLGPAQLAPTTRPRFHYDWHWQWPYGNGDLGNQGIHQVDVARWGLGIDRLAKRVWSLGGRIGYEDAGETPNTQLCLVDFDDRAIVFEVRGLPTDSFMHAGVGVIFHGDQGYAVATSYADMIVFDSTGQKQKEEFHGVGDHFANFIDAVRERNVSLLKADITEGHLSSALCHLGNISYRNSTETISLAELSQLPDRVPSAAAFSNELIVRMTEHAEKNELDLAKTRFHVGPMLKFDCEREVFLEHDAANAMLSREYRHPYVVPTSDKV